MAIIIERVAAVPLVDGSQTTLHSHSGSGAVTSIQDADADTYVRTEQAANENKVRIGVAAVERGLFQTASPHVTLTGDTHITGLGGIGTAPVTVQGLTVRMPAGGIGVMVSLPGGTGGGTASSCEKSMAYEPRPPVTDFKNDW